MLARKEETVVADENEKLASQVASIESNVAHIDRNVAILQVDFRELRKETGEGFKAVNARIDTLLERKIEAVRTGLEGKIDALRVGLEGKIEALRTGLEGKIETFRTELDDRIGALDAKGTKHFLWLLSTMIALALTIGGALLKGLLAH